MATVRDFIFECENYEYSQEYYDFLKECAEIQLMAKYLENQEFRESVNTDGLELTEGYLVEAKSEEANEKVKTTMKEKMGKLKDNLAKKWQVLWTKFMNWLKKISGRLFNSTLDDITSLEKSIGDDVSSEALIKKVSEILSNNSSKYSITGKRSASAAPWSKSLPKFFSKLDKEHKQLFIMATTKGPFFLNPVTGDFNNQNICSVSISELKKILEIAKNANIEDDEKQALVQNKLTNAMRASFKHGTKFFADEDTYELNQMDEFHRNIDRFNKPQYIQDTVNHFGMMTKVLALTMKLYNSLLAFRVNSVDEISAYLKSAAK